MPDNHLSESERIRINARACTADHNRKPRSVMLLDERAKFDKKERADDGVSADPDLGLVGAKLKMGPDRSALRFR
jgi:hypothetical protein